MKIELDPAAIEALAACLLRQASALGLSIAEPPRQSPYTPLELAELLGVSERLIRNKITMGKIRRLGGTGRTLIPVDEAARILKGGF